MTKAVPEILPVKENHLKITYFQAKVVLAIGAWSKMVPDILVDMVRMKPAVATSRTKIYEALLILTAKGLVREHERGWTSSLTSTELDKLREEVDKYEKNIQSYSYDKGDTGGI